MILNVTPGTGVGDEKRQGPFPVGHHRGPRGLPTGARTSSCSLAQPPPPPTQGSGQLRLLKPGGSAGRDQGRWGPRHKRGLCSLQHPRCQDPCHVSLLPEAPRRCGGLGQTLGALPSALPQLPPPPFLSVGHSSKAMDAKPKQPVWLPSWQTSNTADSGPYPFLSLDPPLLPPCTCTLPQFLCFHLLAGQPRLLLVP